jgi:IS30 family transposase
LKIVADAKRERHLHEIHLVNEEDHPSTSHEENPPAANNRIEIGEYIADILVDRRSYPVVVHWIVQRRGSHEILIWGHEDDFEAASREAVAWIDSHLRFDDYRRSLNR